MGVINIQHRCAFEKCQDTGRVLIRQERQDSGVTRKSIQHSDSINYIVNTHSMHNYDLVKKLLLGRFNTQILPVNHHASLDIKKQAAEEVRRLRQPKNTAGKLCTSP